MKFVVLDGSVQYFTVPKIKQNLSNTLMNNYSGSQPWQTFQTFKSSNGQINWPFLWQNLAEKNARRRIQLFVWCSEYDEKKNRS